MKKRLLFTAYSLEVGGIEKALINLLNEIDYDKYEVTLILEKKEGILLDKINKNVIIKELKVSNNKFILFRKIINGIRKFNFKLFNKNKYDFSCCYATYSYSGNIIARTASSNSMIYVHSNYVQSFENNIDKIMEFFDTRNIDKFKYIAFVSNESRKDFIKYYKKYDKKTVVFNNFIDIDEIIKLSKEKIDVKIPTNKKILLFVGRLDDRSKKLGRAFEIIKEIDDTILWIVGDGPDKKKYKEIVDSYKIKDRVFFFGVKKNPYPYMRLSDYILLTSDYEGFPVVYLEAIALEKKIITTIPVSDDKVDIEDYAYIISKNNKSLINDVKIALNSKDKLNMIDIKKLQKERMTTLEKIFDNER